MKLFSSALKLYRTALSTVFIILILLFPAQITFTQTEFKSNVSTDLITGNPAIIQADTSTVFMWATIGDTVALAEWIANGGNPSLSDKYYPLLVRAIQNQQYGVAQMLVNAGADVNKVGWNGYTPLHQAVGKDDTTFITLLLDNGADIEVRDSVDRTPLFLAVDFGCPAAAKLLAERGAHLLALCKSFGNLHSTTPLHHAAAKGFKQIVQILLDAGAGLEALDGAGSTPLEVSWSSESAPGAWCGNTYFTEKMITWQGRETFLFLYELGANFNRITASSQEMFLRGVKYDVPLLIQIGIDRGVNIQGRIKFDLATGEMGHQTPSDKALGRQPIHLAAKFNSVKAIELLIKQGASVETPDTNGFTPIAIAAKWNVVEVINYLLDNGISPNAIDSNGTLALQTALRAGAFTAARLLMDKGADWQKLDFDDSSPLIMATTKGDSDVVKMLIEWGFDPNLPGAGLKRPLHYAAFYGNDYICDLLIKSGAEVNIMDDRESTPLAYALYQTNFRKNSTIQLLLDNGANIEQCWKGGKSPLCNSVLYGDPQLVRMFIEFKDDPNDVDANGNTPIIYCSGDNSAEIARILTEHGANPQQINPIGWTVLHNAAKNKDVKLAEFILSLDSNEIINAKARGSSPLLIAVSQGDTSVARALLKAGADPNLDLAPEQFPVGDKFPFSLAASKNDTTMMKLLFECGAKINLGVPQFYMNDDVEFLEKVIEKRKNQKEQPLIRDTMSIYWAAAYNAVKCAEVLLDAGVDVNMRDYQGQTPLWYAVNYYGMNVRPLQDQSAVADFLLSRGANPDQIEKGGVNLLCRAVENQADWMVSRLLKAGASPNSKQWSRSALHFAVAGENINIVKMLIEAGAEVNATDKNGQTPLDIALKAGKKDLIDVLVKAGAK
jgi:ankyrin repeat protein